MTPQPTRAWGSGCGRHGLEQPHEGTQQLFPSVMVAVHAAPSTAAIWKISHAASESILLWNALPRSMWLRS